MLVLILYVLLAAMLEVGLGSMLASVDYIGTAEGDYIVIGDMMKIDNFRAQIGCPGLKSAKTAQNRQIVKFVDVDVVKSQTTITKKIVFIDVT